MEANNNTQTRININWLQKTLF